MIGSYDGTGREPSSHAFPVLRRHCCESPNVCPLPAFRAALKMDGCPGGTWTVAETVASTALEALAWAWLSSALIHCLQALATCAQLLQKRVIRSEV